jgi:CopG family nickel-responsive transcriptional regulator
METRVTRVSLSLPNEVFDGLEVLSERRGYANRSLAVADILRGEMVNQRRLDPDEVMAGSITLVYDESRPGLVEKLLSTFRRRLKEVVANLSVLLENTMRMDVLIVQGPVGTLDELMAELTALKGVETGKLTLTSAVLPPLHERAARRDA